MRLQGKTRYLILGSINIVVILIGAWMLWNARSEEVGAGFFYQTEDENEHKQVYSTSEMKKGIYDVSLRYTVDDDSYVLSCSARSDGGRYPILYADDWELPQSKNEISFRLWVNSDIDYMIMQMVSGNMAAELSVDSIIFDRNFRLTFTYLMLQVCGLLILLDGIVVVFWERNRFARWIGKNLYVILGILAIFGIASFNVFSVSQNAGDDISFHLARLAGVAEGLAAGEFPVRIQPGWCNGYGYAASVFYGDILLYFPALLYVLGVPLMYAYKVYLFLIHIGTIGIAYYCYQKISSDKYIGLTGTALSALSVIRILNVQSRAALGEYSAYMFFPFVLLGMQEILTQKKGADSEKKQNGWMFLAVGMTGILQTHILSFEMVCIILAVTVFLLFRRLWQGKGLHELVKSTVFAICLNAGFLLPFLDYSRQDLEIFLPKYEHGIQRYGLSLYELFSLPTNGSGNAIRAEEGLHGRFPVSLGIGVMVVILLIVIALFRLEWEAEQKRQLMFVSGLAGMCIWMSTYYFPWDRLAAIPGVGDAVFSIQFPSRFLSPGVPLAAYAGCLALRKLKACIAWKHMKSLLVVLCALCMLQGMYTTDLTMRSSHMTPYDGDQYLYAEASLMGAEYLFKEASREATRSDQEVSGQNVTVTDVARRGNRITATCEAASEAYLEFPMFAYAYYRCIDTQTGMSFPITKGENCKIRVELPADYQGTLTVFFQEPWYWRAAELLSLLTGISLVWILLQKRKKRKRITHNNLT